MEILNFEHQPSGSFAIATFDIYFGPAWGMTLRKFRLCKSKNGHSFIQSPSYKKGEENGKPIFAPYVDFSQEKGKDFSKNVMDLLKPFTE